jgi:hypothetical protein
MAPLVHLKVVYLAVNDRIAKGELVVSEEELLPFADIIETEHDMRDAAGASAEVAVPDVDDGGEMCDNDIINETH